MVICGEAALINNADRVLQHWMVATREGYLLWSKERRKPREGGWEELHTGLKVCLVSQGVVADAYVDPEHEGQSLHCAGEWRLMRCVVMPACKPLHISNILSDKPTTLLLRDTSHKSTLDKE